jgi:transposase InsO family protein
MPGRISQSPDSTAVVGMFYRLVDRLNALSNNLWTIRGTFNGQSIEILVDSGASSIYCSKKIAGPRKLLSINPMSSVELPDGRQMTTHGVATGQLKMGKYKCHIQAHVIDVLDFDLILGLTWLRTVNPKIDWKTLTLEVKDNVGQTHTILSTLPLPVNKMQEALSLNMISYSGIKRTWKRKTTHLHLMFIRTIEPQSHESSSKMLPDVSDTELQRMLKTYESVFRPVLPDGPPPERVLKHSIDTGDASPINLNAYPLSTLQLQEQAKQVTELLNKGLIRESASPWGFPVVFVRKTDQTWRMCIDYRALNAVTKKNGYPLPRIQDCLDQLSHARYMTKLDLTSGYWQVRLNEPDMHKTAFNTRQGKFEFVAMPFGLTNAPATFQTLMNSILRPYLDKFVIVYLDDIVIYSRSIEKHRTHVKLVLELLHKHFLYAKPSKCILCVQELDFCGHVVGHGKVRPMESKIKVIRDWPQPTNVHEVRSFLGLAAYYRRFIAGFSRISVPLYDLIKESDADVRKQKFRKIIWSAICEQAFVQLKELLTSQPVLALPDDSRPFLIETDASDWAIGCSLLQADENGRTHPVAYDGRKLSTTEFNYPVHEKELLAIKNAIRVWRYYIDNGKETIVLTDHESLKYMQTTKTPSKRLARWIAEFQEYNLRIQYRPGKYAIVPDAISRRPDFLGALRDTQSNVSDDKFQNAMIALLEKGTEPEDPTFREVILSQKDKFAIETSNSSGKLVRILDNGQYAPYIEPLYRADLIERMHNEYGHLGNPGLLGVLEQRGWWHTIQKDVQTYVRFCPNCQVSQRQQLGLERERPLHLASTTIQPFERWALDFIGILPTTPNGNKWIITAIDYATGWPIAKATSDALASTVADFLHDEIFVHYGAPMELLSDNGTNIVGDVVRYYTQQLGLKHRTTTPYHPRTNGKVERFNGLLGSILTRYLMGKPTKLWDQYLSQALFATRVRVHATTKQSPFYLLYGIHPRLPSDENPIRPIEIANPTDSHEKRIAELANARTEANRRTYQKALNATTVRDELVTQTSFKPDDYVLVRHPNPQKFESKWYGPYKVTRCMPLGTYQLADPNDRPLRNLINGQRLLKANVTGDVTKLWSSSAIQAGLKRSNITVEKHSDEVRELLDAVNDSTPTYPELAVMSKTSYQQTQKERTTGQAETLANTAEPSRAHGRVRPRTIMPEASREVSSLKVVEGEINKPVNRTAETVDLSTQASSMERSNSESTSGTTDLPVDALDVEDVPAEVEDMSASDTIIVQQPPVTSNGMPVQISARTSQPTVNEAVEDAERPSTPQQVKHMDKTSKEKRLKRGHDWKPRTHGLERANTSYSLRKKPPPKDYT